MRSFLLLFETVGKTLNQKLQTQQGPLAQGGCVQVWLEIVLPASLHGAGGQASLHGVYKQHFLCALLILGRASEQRMSRQRETGPTCQKLYQVLAIAGLD